METKMMRVSDESLALAKNLIESGDVVAFPTETVYGLGANAFDEKAVAKIFEAKGRPSDNPLIVHVANKEDVCLVAEHVTDDAKKIISSLMPGAITIVLKKKKSLPDVVTAGLDTVAVRIPMSSEAREFLKFVGVPVCAPSANTSTRPSPTTHMHVMEDLNGKIPLILQGEQCEIGIESTVLDLTGRVPTILREGSVSQSQIAAVLDKQVNVASKFDSKQNSPGLRYKHYAPKVETFLCENFDKNKVLAKTAGLMTEGKVAVVLALNNFRDSLDQVNFMSLGDTEQEGAKNLFFAMRNAEKIFDAIIIVWQGSSDIGRSVMSRVRKSCEGKRI